MKRLQVIVVGAVLLSTIVVGALTISPITSAEATTAVPSRILDTRNGIGRGAGLVGPGDVVRVTAPAAATGGASLVLNVTATNALEPGFVTVWACDEAKPVTSNLNFVPGRAVPNMAIIRPSAATDSAGQICLESSASVHLLVDFMGWFSSQDDVAPTPPNRIVDTRQTRDPLRKGEFRRVQVAGTQGVPANARAALLNVTLTGAANAGFLSVVPCPASGGSIPGTSTMNFAPGDTVAAFTIAALVNGEICLYSDSAADVIVDTFGWSPLDGGLRVKTPERVLDTRNGIWSTGPARSGEVVRVRVAGRGGIPNESLAALLTVTVSDTASSGYVTAWPCDVPKPETSVLNFWPGSARANSVLVGLSVADGEVCLSASANNGSNVSLIADAVGWVPGTLVRPPVPAPQTSPSFGGCAVFPSTYAFNAPIGSSPVRPESSAVIGKTNATGNSTKLQFAFWSNPLSGMHPIVVPRSQPLVPIIYDQYPQESDTGPFPIPLDAPQEDNSDKHVIVVQQGTCKLYELWATHRSPNGWYAGTGAEWDLSVSATRPPRWTSADAAGLPILPGLLRYDEVASGRVNHALRMTVGFGRRAVVAPATHFVGSDDPLLLPMGARLRLRSDFDTSRFTGQSRVIVEALKTYGLIVADNGPNWMISGVGDSRWDDSDMNQIRNISASDLVFVDSGPVVTP